MCSDCYFCTILFLSVCVWTFNTRCSIAYSLPGPSPKTAASAPSGPVVPQLTPFPGLPLPGMPSAPQLVPTRVWSEYSTPEGKPYFYNKVTRVSVWEKPKDFDLVMPLPAELGGAPSRAPQSQAQQFPSSNAGEWCGCASCLLQRGFVFFSSQLECSARLSRGCLSHTPPSP